MKQLLILLFLFLWGCSNEIDLYPDDVPSVYVVYGILDVNDSVQQIKVRRTFTDGGLDEGASGGDSLFMPDPDIQVRIEKVGGEPYSSVDFTVTEYPKVAGFFASDKNPIHEAVFTPEQNASYRLVIDLPSEGQTVQAELKTIRTPMIIYPFNGDASYQFADTANPFVFRFTATGEVHLQQFYINFIEVDTNGDTLFCHNRFDLAPRYKDSTYVVRYYNREMTLGYLFNIIRLRVDNRQDVAFRMLHSFDYYVWAGDQVLNNYLQFAATFPDNRKMFFSNVDNAFGFFAAASHASVENLYPTQPFFDTLVTNPVTDGLKFLNRRYTGHFIKE